MSLFFTDTQVIEKISARKYYGRHATGSVILVNYNPVFHETHPQVIKIFREMVTRAMNEEATACNEAEKDAAISLHEAGLASF
jgi:hypothetical protein